MGDEDINLPIYYVVLTAAGYRHPPYTSPDLLLKLVTAHSSCSLTKTTETTDEKLPPGPLFKQKIAGGVYNIRILYIRVCVCTNLLVISAYTPAARKLSAVKAIRWAV